MKACIGRQSRLNVKVPLLLRDTGLEGRGWAMLESKHGALSMHHQVQVSTVQTSLGTLEYSNQAQDLLPEFHDRRGEVLRVAHCSGF